MTENLRRRTSKWDVALEPPSLSIRQTDEPPMRAHDSANEFVSKSEFNYSILEENRESFSLPSEMKNEPTRMTKENDEADKLTELSRIPKAKYQSSRIPKLSDLDANQHREGENFGRVREGWDNRLDQNYGRSLSPGRNAWRQRSPTSPKRSWSRTHRSRSRSQSRSRSRSWGRGRSRSRSRSPSFGLRRGPDRYRSRSPPYDARRGPEKWGVRGRMGGGPPVPCRDYAAGRCDRGNDCRFLHDDNGRRQSSRYYDNGASDARESRGDRGRFSDMRESSDYPRERFSSRNDRPPPICYEFTKGQCQRGSSCRYPHHDASHDVRSRAHDEETRRAVRDTPCKFFADGQCRRGEGCRFSHHIVGPHENSNSSWNDLNQSDQTAIMDTSNSSSQWMGNNEDNPRVDDSRSSKPQLSHPQVSESNIYQNQLYVATQPIQPQNSIPNVQIPQLVPPIPLNGQLQQPIFPLPQNAQQVQFMAPNISMQNLPILPPTQIGQTQQNYILPQLPHDINLSGQIPQNLPLLAPLNGQTLPNFNFNGQNLNVVPQAPVSENLNLNEQPSQVNPDTAITPKVVTSEQAAQITNLSASLAQFFGSTQIAPGLVPVSQPNTTSGNMEQGIIDNKNLPPGFDQKDSIIKEAEAKNETDDGNPPIKDGNPPTKDVELEVKLDVSEAETADNKKEKGGDVDADVKADGEAKPSKDGKATKMFKCALVEFVKDVLKPSWKEGHLSKEAHKTIVKKVVEKVTSATQSQSIPQTQEKIDLYFLHSKAKLTKLVQAYLEKYVKS